MWVLIFLRDFVAVPAFLVAIFTLIGALLQKRKITEITISVFKVIVGFLILGGGAGVLVGSLNNFQPLFEVTYNLNGVIPNNDAFAGLLATALPRIATLGSLIMIVGMVMNLILAAFSRFKYVYLSGHVLYYTSLMLATVMYTIGFDFENNVSDFVISLFAGSSVIAVYMVLSPASQQRYMRLITGTNEIGLGHTGGFGYAISGLIGEVIYKLKKGKVTSTEAIKFPKGLFFFRNTLVSISITIFIFYMFAFIPSGIMYDLGRYTQEVDGVHVPLPGLENVVKILSSPHWLVQMFLQAFIFTAGVEIILIGVRMFIGELVPLFKGISDRFIKNSKAAVDCPVVYPYAPNAVIIGFISSFVGGIIGMGITIGLSGGQIIVATILPGLVPHFFLGATSGVFGNVKGGIWGAIVGPLIMGIFITFIPVIFLAGKWVPGTNEQLSALAARAEEPSSLISLNWGDTDYIIGAIPGVLGLISKWVAFGLALIIYFGLIVDGLLLKYVSWWPRRKTQLSPEENLDTNGK
ncbi:PTS system ascorbate-specific IIC component [Mycoplasmoides fastidiosum]|uniref:Ascorbate-specific PTS system EIIC component n=1 Tax=Mycoplasmoides fastidiosum TaxID=92758 RepID=A0ABU0LZ40_9BACT|nr:PTS ascorbate transporter subunit IIC [Mycoplasmoides fastidiosum]MDQ0513955.1 PTS system ascorbate-specific IIC component [Mycoplasmoides fastidiosum]UUD37631.1 PTS transporter subunit IIC [Mycoplasmoides fastidiosum]